MANNDISRTSLPTLDLERSQERSIGLGSQNRSALSEEGRTSHSNASAIRTLDAARELGPQIRSAADEIEQGRRLPMHLVREMQRTRIFRMAMPRAWGGPELDFLTQVRVIEELSIADASAGWCAMIGVDGGYMTAFIDQGVAREMYADIDSATAITFAPPGKAVKTRNGFIANGRWPFGSGCQHATWLIGHFAVFDGDSPRLLPNGLPETRFGFVPAEEAKILDTWTSNGLRGSGSHDWMVKDRFIPEERTFNLAAPINYRKGPLYTLPNLLIYKVCAVPLGIARGAIDEFVNLASNKPLTFKSPSATKAMLRDEVFVQSAVAQAEALVGSARGFVFEAFGNMWETLANGALLRSNSALVRGLRWLMPVPHVLKQSSFSTRPTEGRPCTRAMCSTVACVISKRLTNTRRCRSRLGRWQVVCCLGWSTITAYCSNRHQRACGGRLQAEYVAITVSRSGYRMADRNGSQPANARSHSRDLIRE
jgi:indole-3-acetate monooxygenase